MDLIETIKAAMSKVATQAAEHPSGDNAAVLTALACQ